MSEKPTYEELEKRVQKLHANEFARKIAERELLESEDKFRSIAENSLVGVYIIQDGIFIYVNKKFAEIFGYSVKECLNNMHFQQTVYQEDLDLVKNEISMRVSGKNRSVNYQFRGIKKGGEILNVEIYGSSMLLNGKVSVTGSLLDITKRKQTEKHRDELIEKLKKALSEVKTLRGFLPICSHCHKIRDDKGYWERIESYIQSHSDVTFSHSICQECAEKYYHDMDIDGEEKTYD